MSLSRIGKPQIEIPSGVTITVDSGDVNPVTAGTAWDQAEVVLRQFDDVLSQAEKLPPEQREAVAQHMGCQATRLMEIAREKGEKKPRTKPHPDRVSAEQPATRPAQTPDYCCPPLGFEDPDGLDIPIG